jgi:hypothetical protein
VPAWNEKPTLFRDCMIVFRRAHAPNAPPGANLMNYPPTGHVLLDFMSCADAKAAGTTIGASHVVDLQGGYRGFVSEVTLPPTVGRAEAISFTAALATVMSFAIGRLVRVNDRYPPAPLSRRDIFEIASQMPIHRMDTDEVSTARQSIMRASIADTADLLLNASEDVYTLGMQAIRLVHLSHMTKADDFGLSYYLLISAIESLAQSAIPQNAVKTPDPRLAGWESHAAKDSIARQILQAYKGEIKNTRSLGKRFVKFVLEFCPPAVWSEMEHRDQDKVALQKEWLEQRRPWVGGQFDGLVEMAERRAKKSWHELYPEDLPPQELSKVLSMAYEHRSQFTHIGQPPPHREARAFNKFFTTHHVVEGERLRQLVLPTYELVNFIARRSIFEYLLRKVPGLSLRHGRPA